MSSHSSPSFSVALTPEQERALALACSGGSLLLHGPPGVGKTTALQVIATALVAGGERPDRILVLLPQRAHIERYERDLTRLLAEAQAPAAGGVDLVTFNGLCRRLVALFWPLIAADAGFAHPEREPTFLTIETTQYYMWRVVEGLIAHDGYFSSLSVRRARLLSQLIDNLNKSALVGFPHTEIAARLRGAWMGSPQRLIDYGHAQDCALRFREYCLAHNLLDFSLCCETFVRCLVPRLEFAAYMTGHYDHLMVDNAEENVPVAHDLVRWLLPRCRTAVLARDAGAGYRVFLGADADGARDLGEACDHAIAMERPLVGGAAVRTFAGSLCRALGAQGENGDGAESRSLDGAIRGQGGGQYWVGMVRWVAERIRDLVAEGVRPGQIAVVAPYVSDVLRFTLEEALAQGRPRVRVYSLRPALAMRDEPLIRGMLSLARLAHPGWEVRIQGQEYPLTREDVALALGQALEGLDPIRAHHLSGVAYDVVARRLEPWVAGLPGAAAPSASRAAEAGRMWDRVGHQVREPFARLVEWLEATRAAEPEPLDLLFQRLFGDLLCRRGFALRGRPDLARVYGRLVESAANYMAGVGEGWLDPAEHDGEPAAGANLDYLGAEYIALMIGGIASAEYVSDRPSPEEDDAVVLAPAYAYLTRDLRSAYQFWVDLSSEGWWNRPNQPLTHPYVLSRRWPAGRPWRDEDEERERRAALARVLRGLAARCEEGVYLASSQLGIGGEEQSGRLERAVLTALTGNGHAAEGGNG